MTLARSMFPPLADRPRASVASGLARQERDRKKALRRLAKLRKKASDEIERLLAFLDASDPYAATELEHQVDDEPCDTDELEMGWTGLTANAGNMPHQDWVDEAEADGAGREADFEPSLGGVAADESGDQSLWASGGALDLEGEHDGQEPAFCGLTADRASHANALGVL